MSRIYLSMRSTPGKYQRHMISLVIIVEAAPGKAEDFQKFITEEAADVVAHEPGCVRFLVSRSRENENLFTLAEFYVDEEALEAHR